MRKKTAASRIRRMIAQGHDTNTIVAKLRVDRRRVYNTRYQMRLAQGLGALPVQRHAETGIKKPAPTLAVRVKRFVLRLMGRPC